MEESGCHVLLEAIMMAVVVVRVVVGRVVRIVVRLVVVAAVWLLVVERVVVGRIMRIVVYLVMTVATFVFVVRVVVRLVVIDAILVFVVERVVVHLLVIVAILLLLVGRCCSEPPRPTRNDSCEGAGDGVCVTEGDDRDDGVVDCHEELPGKRASAGSEVGVVIGGFRHGRCTGKGRCGEAVA